MSKLCSEPFKLLKRPIDSMGRAHKILSIWARGEGGRAAGVNITSYVRRYLYDKYCPRTGTMPSALSRLRRCIDRRHF